MKNAPLVSVVIPTKNRSGMVCRAIYSVLNQTYRNVEVVVVDDGSSDDTAICISNINDSRLKYFPLIVSKGACVARNEGIKRSGGEFITFLDDDDEFLPERIQEMVNAWSPRFSFVCSGYYYIKRKKSVKIFIPQKNVFLDDILYKINIGNSVLTLRSRVMEVGGFDESLESSQDYDLWIRLICKYGSALCVQLPLFIMHTEHGLPRITTSKKKASGHFLFYKKHKRLMNKSQRKAKLLEVLRYKNKKISLSKIFWLGTNVDLKEKLKYYIKSRYFNVIKFIIK